jgi:hypothetical protein
MNYVFKFWQDCANSGREDPTFRLVVWAQTSREAWALGYAEAFFRGYVYEGSCGNIIPIAPGVDPAPSSPGLK